MKKLRVDFRVFGVFALAVACGGMLLHVSQMVQEAEDNLDRLAHSTSAHEESIKVLNAEWSYLNSPKNLEVLATEYLNLQPPKSEVLTSDDLPLLYGDMEQEETGIMIQPVSAISEVSDGAVSADAPDKKEAAE